MSNYLQKNFQYSTISDGRSTENDEYFYYNIKFIHQQIHSLLNLTKF